MNYDDVKTRRVIHEIMTDKRNNLIQGLNDVKEHVMFDVELWTHDVNSLEYKFYQGLVVKLNDAIEYIKEELI